MTVSILGCGWYGSELGKALVNKWIKVKGSTTSANKLPWLAGNGIEPYLINLTPNDETIDAAFFECDVLWISIPPQARAGNGAAYLLKVERLISLIKSHGIKQVVLVSSTGVYGDTNTVVTEVDAPKPDSESGKILLAAEDLLKQQTDFTTTIVRFAGLIGPGRDPGRFFAGRAGVPNGAAPVNLIHLTDCIGISCAVLDKQAFGYTYNAVSPSHPTRSNFYTQAAIDSDLEIPQFADEQQAWKLVSGVNVGEVLGYDYKVLV
ncbi:NAD(P)H-binding protein [Mucilaginibacter sp. UR6-11]|uniref:NAD(P)H-binding protein n=1 Tax=Mucilaginibacter sp. UR6-11 TaxID=1435644 RepID=UPI001E45DB7A|nr:NAD(P)H-binding protein [Mucilaginibacter sp. UR6-11]MCC8426733.1 NAD(P)H-binding protein [Mucilaginibacter sp. UR6-11]